jgi:hypothetical protein
MPNSIPGVAQGHGHGAVILGMFRLLKSGRILRIP